MLPSIRGCQMTETKTTKTRGTKEDLAKKVEALSKTRDLIWSGDRLRKKLAIADLKNIITLLEG
tara:strand:+ start:231 stop:422 length:192 start_codon:yes stop_codon:yes gene_type:complete